MPLEGLFKKSEAGHTYACPTQSVKPLTFRPLAQEFLFLFLNQTSSTIKIEVADILHLPSRVQDYY